MMAFLFAAAVAIVLVALYASARAAVTVCVLDVVAGRVFVRRGGLASRIRSDIEDVAARPKIGRATLRILRDRGSAVAMDVLLRVLRDVPGGLEYLRKHAA
jgi:hypothetical protein